jgi:hypothetical protein
MWHRLLAPFALAAAAGCLDYDQFTADRDRDAAVARDLAVPRDLLAGDLATADAFRCEANQFLQCMGNQALYCDDAGAGTRLVDCGAPCVPGGTDCNICKPGSTYCIAGGRGTCTAAGGRAPFTTDCLTLGGPSACLADGSDCAQCAGTAVCGDGQSWVTQVDVSYLCNGGLLDLMSARHCGFGCDPKNGLCRDLIPASDARNHMGPAANGQLEAFSCAGRGSAAATAIAPMGAGPQVLLGTGDLNATKPSIKVCGGGVCTTPLGSWGPVYMPPGSTTPARVLHVASIDLPAGTAVTLGGQFALILLVDGDVNIGQGTQLMLSAANASAPWFNSNAKGGAGVFGGQGLLSGGSGAGHGDPDAGGTGGPGSLNANPIPGGTPYGPDFVLEAGAPGGSGGPVADGSFGGHGGGALQISACGKITVADKAWMNASGGGGLSTHTANPSPSGGGGGGSGGTLLLEARDLSITGFLVANGGGGAEGSTAQINGRAGFNWSPNGGVNAPAPGGSGNTMGAAGAGGAGGADGSPPQGGKPAPSLNGGGGGGGGAVGRIFLNVAPGAMAPAAVASPKPRTSVACVTDDGVAPNPCVYP